MAAPPRSFCFRGSGAKHCCALQVWDVRKPNAPTKVLLGHTYPVRKVAFSPHAAGLLLSCSYDMTVRLLDLSTRSRSVLCYLSLMRVLHADVLPPAEFKA